MNCKSKFSVFMIVSAWSLLIASPQPGYAQNMDPKNADAVEHGETSYARHCASCHGANLEGAKNWRERNPDGSLPPPPHDETGHTWHHPEHMLFKITKAGGQAIVPPTFKSAMPAFNGLLTDKEIWNVLSFIKSRWPESIQKRHDRINERMDHMNRMKR